MGWNIEVVAVRADELSKTVPDVFEATDSTMGFEEATSHRRAPDLCAAKVGDWVAVIDVLGRMAENDRFLADASASTDLHLVQITSNPIALHYRNGQAVAELNSREMEPDDDYDRESVAMAYLHDATGLTMYGSDEDESLRDKDLGYAKYTLFVLPRNPQ